MSVKRNRLVRVSVEFPEAHITVVKHYHEDDIAALRVPRECVGSGVLDMIERLQEITENDPY